MIRPVRPYLKWVGNKFKMLKHIIPLMPHSYKDYYEPFLGSGAVYFNVAVSHDMYQLKNGRNYYLSDANGYLINCHQVVANQPEQLQQELEYFTKNDGEDFYIEQRRLVTSDAVGVRAAARMIYLNRRSYGGMWRVNSSGEYNVPKSPEQDSKLWRDGTMVCSRLLRRAHLECKNYRCIQPQPGDFVFLDPPYYPVSETANFTAYTQDAWSEQSHVQLMEFLKELHNKGVSFLMTNNKCPFVCKRIEELGFRFVVNKVYRYIDALSYQNGKHKNERAKVEEIFVFNY